MVLFNIDYVVSQLEEYFYVQCIQRKKSPFVSLYKLLNFMCCCAQFYGKKKPAYLFHLHVLDTNTHRFGTHS